MLMPFQLFNPTTVEQAAELLGQIPGAKIVSGGTDVFVEMHAGVKYPALVDLKGIEALRYIRFDEKTGLVIGALATYRELERNTWAQTYYPALIDAVSTIGSVQVRSKGTVAGNICTASPAADCAGPLLLYDAEITIAGKMGERVVPVREFFTGVKRTCLKQGELVTKIALAPPVQNSGSGYVKLKKRGAMEIGIMSAGARFATDTAGNCTLARIAMSAVNPTPVRVQEAEAFILGKALTAENLKELARLAYQKAAPQTWRNSEEWSREMVRVYIPKVVDKALDRLGKGGY